jgi:DNA modification methylase
MGCEFITADILDWAKTQPDDRFDLVFGSPPYCDARTYEDETLPEGVRCHMGCEEWVAWMIEVSLACQRICKGPIFWVCAGVTRKRNYWPGPEGLSWEWWKRGGDCQLYRPCAFVKTCGIPGNGGNDYFRSDWEYVLCLKKPGALAWSDNTACGRPPKRPDLVHSFMRKIKDGTMKKDKHLYVAPEIANPGNVITGNVSNGHLGSPSAHLGEAPFPEWLAERFILSFCPPGGIVLDPFSGTGTTAAVAVKYGRNAVGVDIRESQTKIARKREKPLSLFA